MTWAFALALAATAAVAGLLWRQRGMEEREDAPPAEDARVSPLLKGINYLLSDEPDRALQELVRVARLQTETAEVYLALGDLFRNKGEFGRAVRIHQNLLARPGLSRELRMDAQAALALDFQTGGLLGRALREYEKVLEMDPGHARALEAILRIREQQQEWREAAEALARLDRVRGTDSSLHMAYLQTEMARAEREAGNEAQAMELVREAIATDPECAAAHLLLAEMALDRGDEEAAFASMEALRRAAPRHLPLLVRVLLERPEVYERRGRDFLMGCWRDGGDETLALEWIRGVAARDGVEAARELARALDFKPEGLRALLHLRAIIGPDDAETRAARRWVKQARNHACAACGVEVISMRWQCPQCHEWGSMRPIREERLS